MSPTIFTLSSFLLLSPGEIQQPEAWAPERGEVAFDDGGRLRHSNDYRPGRHRAGVLGRVDDRRVQLHEIHPNQTL